MKIGNLITFAALVGAGYFIYDALKKRDATQKTISSVINPLVPAQTWIPDPEELVWRI